jgi:putative membrane protein
VREQENVGSVARDQLANERTFLAWIRTGLGLVGVGVVLAKWVEGGLVTELGGLGFVVWGAGLLGYAYTRYRAIAALLERGKYRTARVGPIIVTIAGLIAAAVAGAMVFL